MAKRNNGPKKGNNKKTSTVPAKTPAQPAQRSKLPQNTPKQILKV